MTKDKDWFGIFIGSLLLLFIGFFVAVIVAFIYSRIVIANSPQTIEVINNNGYTCVKPTYADPRANWTCVKDKE